MRRLFIQNFLFLLVGIGAMSGFDAYGNEIDIDPKYRSVLLPIAPCQSPLGDLEDSQEASAAESDKEIEDDDDSSASQQLNNLQFASKVNLLFVFQSALFQVHHREIVSPPPKF
ncbi:MAG: hypothetical protein JJE09_03305 [Bacteroidia bacterium]|nr:hypothetical protein [Bacteroidia bacterium]